MKHNFILLIDAFCLLFPTCPNRMSDLIDKHPCLRRNQPPRRHPAQIAPTSAPYHCVSLCMSVPSRTAAPANQSGVRMIPTPSTAACKSDSELSEISGPVGRQVFCWIPLFSTQSSQLEWLQNPRQACSANASRVRTGHGTRYSWARRKADCEKARYVWRYRTASSTSRGPALMWPFASPRYATRHW